MKSQKSIILVPTDFSSVAECALNHACVIAQKSQDEVMLLHVINNVTKSTLKKSKEGIETLVKKLHSQCNYYSQKYNLKVNYIFEEGSIFKTIETVRAKIDASLVVMGTHGVKGMQHVTGAWALKVVASSKVPVIVVQNKLPENNGYQNIVSPIDYSAEIKQKTKQTISIAKIFDSKVHLFKQAGYDASIENKIKLNLQFVKKYLKENNIEVLEAKQEKKSKDLAKDFINYAKETGADLIVILTTAEKDIKDIVLGPVEQMVINNTEQIPVMCINPMQNLYKSERLASVVNLSF